MKKPSERTVEEIVEEVINEYREMFNELMFMGKLSKEWPGIDREIFADHLRKRMRPILQAERQKREEAVREILEEMAEEFDTNENADYRAWQWANDKLQAITNKTE